MARVRLISDDVAFDLLIATVEQARRDLILQSVQLEDRASALELFVDIADIYEEAGLGRYLTERTAASAAGGQDLRSKRRKMHSGSSVHRGRTSKSVGRKPRKQQGRYECFE